jgi:hypothetical protein
MNEPHFNSQQGPGTQAPAAQPVQRLTPAAHPPVAHPPALHPPVAHGPIGHGPATVTPVINRAPMVPKPVSPMKEEALSLVEESAPQSGAPTQSKIHGFSSTGGGKQFADAFKRKTNVLGTGAIRVKSFHGRLSEQGLDYLDHAINEWLDNHADIEIKNISSSVGMFDGKMKEPAVILNLWY